MTDLPTMGDVLRSETDLNDIEDANERWLLARIRLTEQRRAQDARRTWSPFDQNVPDQAVVTVTDLDGDVWNLVGATPAGPWRMRDFDPEKHETRAGQNLGWQELVYEYAPLTDAAAPAGVSR